MVRVYCRDVRCPYCGKPVHVNSSGPHTCDHCKKRIVVDGNFNVRRG